MMSGEITRNLRAWAQGDDSVLDELMPFIMYEDKNRQVARWSFGCRCVSAKSGGRTGADASV
jgi:hypothetical protein